MKISLQPTRKKHAVLLQEVKETFQEKTFSKAIYKCLEIGIEIERGRREFRQQAALQKTLKNRSIHSENNGTF